MDDLEEGVFIQYTLEIILNNTDGKQLIAEAIYLYGVILLLLDEKIEGVIRERMIVSYIRCKGSGEETLSDEISRLMAQTGYVPGMQKKPPGYPTTFFER